LILLSFYLLQVFRLERETPLEVEPADWPTAVSFAMDSEGFLYYTNYWRHEVAKLSPNGRILFSVGHKGQGPGEYYKPRCLTLINKETELLFVGDGEKVQIFSTHDGSFARTLAPFFPANGWLEEGDGHLLALKGPGEDLLDVIAMSGEKTGSWMRGPAELSGALQGTLAFTIDPIGNVYVSYGVYPLLYYAAPRQAVAQEWAIGVPHHYREPPKKAFPLEQRFDRKKVEAYYDSFSQVYGLYVLPESDVLLVVWKINEPVPYAVEAYDLKTRQRVLANFHPRGRPVCSRGELLACEEILEDEAGELLAHNLVLYRYQRQ
jgi:hypothetical protein